MVATAAARPRSRRARKRRGARGEHRAHLHPLERIVAALEPHFHVGTPHYGPYLYRWDLDESLRHHEEDAIARAEIPAVGARLLAQRHL